MFVLFVKQKTAYEMRMSDLSSDVCSSDLPQHDLAARQQRGFGAVVSLEVKGGKEGAWRFIDATRLISITANLGDSKTTITHPSTTSHGRLAPQEREAAGIRDSLIRVAVGLEDVADQIGRAHV